MGRRLSRTFNLFRFKKKKFVVVFGKVLLGKRLRVFSIGAILKDKLMSRKVTVTRKLLRKNTFNSAKQNEPIR